MTIFWLYKIKKIIISLQSENLGCRCMQILIAAER